MRDHLGQVGLRQVQSSHPGRRLWRCSRFVSAPDWSRSSRPHGSVSQMATRKPTGTQPIPGRARRALAEPHEPVIRSVARNRRARHDYDILEVYECGIALRGAEVQVAQGRDKRPWQDAFARIDSGELWLLGAHCAVRVRVRIRSFRPGQGPQITAAPPTDRRSSRGRVAQKALTLVPLQHLLQRRPRQSPSSRSREAPALRQAARHRRTRR